MQRISKVDSIGFRLVGQKFFNLHYHAKSFMPMSLKDSLIHWRPLQAITTRRFLLARTNQFKHIKIIYCHKNLVTKKLDAETSQSRICWLRASCTKYFSFSWCNECIWIHKIFHGSKRFIDSCRPFKVMSTRCNSYLYAQIFSSTSNNIAAVYFHYTLVKPSVLSFNFSAILLEMLQKARYSDFVVQSILLASGELDIKFSFH